MGGIGKAFGKLLLFGEHAAVYGHPAIGMALPECITVRLSAGHSGGWDLEDIAPEDREMIGKILVRMEELLPEIVSRGRCAVRIESDLPRGVGFGSSAALCAALAQGALDHARVRDRGGEIDRAWGLAHGAERLFHGTPSGIDTGLSLIGGMCVFHPRPPELPLWDRIKSPPLSLVVAAVPREADCGELISGLAARVRSGDRTARASIESLGRLARDAEEALREGGPRTSHRIADLAEEAMARLRGLGMSSQRLDRLLRAGKGAGALGGKLSGAGAGGAFFLVARDLESARAVAGRLEREAHEAGIPLSSPVRIMAAGEAQTKPGSPIKTGPSA